VIPGLLLSSALLAAPPAPAPQPSEDAIRGRWHFVFEEPLQPRFEYSLLFTRTAAGDETTLLVKTRAGRLELVSRQDASERDSTESLRDLEGNETFTRRLLFAGAPAVEGCEAVKAPDPCLVFTGSRGRLVTGLSAFTGEGASALRQRARQLVSDALERRLRELAAVFRRSVEFEAYLDDFLGLVWPDDFKIGRAGFAKGTRTRGCAFDAEFGYPCSEKERWREGRRFPD
jgi:hypothetical protein